MPNREPNLLIEKRLGFLAWAAWFVVWAGVAILVWPSPIKHNDDAVYQIATKQWWMGRGLYDGNYGVDGFLYLPQFTLIYSPFAFLDHPIGDVAWRALGIGLLASGLWRSARILSRLRRPIVFALATAATLPPAMASLRNGQANLFLAGIMLHAAVDLSQARWWRATAWLCGGVIVKPIFIVMFLLAGAVYRSMIYRLALGAAISFFLPFAFQHPDYVASQYYAYGRVLDVSSNPPDLYCNFRGLIGKMGWVMSHDVFNALAAVAAAATLGFCLVGRRRFGEPWRVFFLVGFSACYLMVFNPRTESNSYVILAPVIALPAAVLLLLLDRPKIAAALYVLAFMLVCDGWAYKQTENWLKPLTCLVVWGSLIYLLVHFGCSAKRNISNEKECGEPALNVL